MRLARLLALFLSASPALAAEPAASAPRAARQQSPEDLAAIRAVLDRFMEAIAKKDARLLSSLVLHSRITYNTIDGQPLVDETRRFDANFDVTFDYVFLEDGKPSNHGLEHWLLRKTDGAWKIFSVVWTMREGAPR